MRSDLTHRPFAGLRTAMLTRSLRDWGGQIRATGWEAAQAGMAISRFNANYQRVVRLRPRASRPPKIRSTLA